MSEQSSFEAKDTEASLDRDRERRVAKVREYFENFRWHINASKREGSDLKNATGSFPVYIVNEEAWAEEIQSIIKGFQSNDYSPAFEYIEKQAEFLRGQMEKLDGRGADDVKASYQEEIDTLEALKENLTFDESEPIDKAERYFEDMNLEERLFFKKSMRTFTQGMTYPDIEDEQEFMRLVETRLIEANKVVDEVIRGNFEPADEWLMQNKDNFKQENYHAHLMRSLDRVKEASLIRNAILEGDFQPAREWLEKRIGEYQKFIDSYEPIPDTWMESVKTTEETKRRNTKEGLERLEKILSYIPA